MKKTAVIGFLFLLVIISCESPFHDIKSERAQRAENSDGEIIIGIVAPWEQLEKSTGYLNGLEMAKEEINADRPEKGRLIRFIKRDDEANAEKGKSIAMELANNLDCMAVIGHFNSHVSDVVSIIYEHNGLLMFSPAYSGSFLTGRGFKYVFRNTPTDEEIGLKIADFMKSRRYIWSLVYHVNAPHERTIANAFGKQTERYGYKVVNHRSFAATSDIKTFRKMLFKDKKDHHFNAIFLAGDSAHAEMLISEARRLGISEPIIGTPEILGPETSPDSSNRMKGTVMAAFFHPDDPRKEVREFVEKYEKRYGEKPDGWAAQGYDAVRLLVHAMDTAGSGAPGKVAKELRRTADWTGVTGRHTFNEKGDAVAKPLVFQVARDKGFDYLPFSSDRRFSR